MKQWVWGRQDYSQLLKDAGLVPSQQCFAACTLSRTMNYAMMSREFKTSELNLEKEIKLDRGDPLKSFRFLLADTQ